MALSLKDILEALDALSEAERAVIRQHLESGPGRPSREPLSTLLATWDESISLQDAGELNRVIRQSRLSQTEPPTF
jgi:hypothetical protein